MKCKQTVLVFTKILIASEIIFKKILNFRYKILLGPALTDTFLNVGDGSGSGADHCELVGGLEADAVMANDYTTAPALTGTPFSLSLSLFLFLSLSLSLFISLSSNTKQNFVQFCKFRKTRTPCLPISRERVNVIKNIYSNILF